MKKFFRLVMILAVSLGLSSCFVTKKKCDCPSYGLQKSGQPVRHS